ncbi:MAG: hypothetical protein AB7E77_11785 [Desulfobulbus sp.]
MVPSGRRQRVLAVVMLLAILLPCNIARADEQGADAGAAPADTVAALQCRDLAAQVEAQNHQLRQELRQIKRELAMLNQNLDKPGAREVMAGIGYILGLFGVAALVANHRRGQKED